MLLGPPWTDTGEPGALANNDCDALEGVLPEGQEKKTNDAAIKSVNCPAPMIAAGILTTEINARLLPVDY